MIGEEKHEPVTRTGDVWLLGNHRLACGDNSDAVIVNNLFEGKKSRLLFTSPPYDNQRSYTVGTISWTHMMQGMTNNIPYTDDMQILVNLGVIHRDGEWQPYWNDWIEWCRIVGWRRFAWYVWDMGRALPGVWCGRFAPNFEFIFHFNQKARIPNKIIKCSTAGKPTKETQNGGLRRKDGTPPPKWTDGGKPVQEWRIPTSIVRVNRHVIQGIEREHPAVFPPALPEFIMRAWTDEGDIVYDPFVGSGSSLIGAENTNRKCYAVDIAPEYIDIAIRRWLKMNSTYYRAVLESNGKTFKEVADERGVEMPDDKNFRELTGTKILDYEPKSDLTEFM